MDWPIMDLACIKEEIFWYMLFANDIMLVDGSRDCVDVKIQGWWKTLESRGFISHTKMEYMYCNFNGDVRRDVTHIRTEVRENPQRKCFKYCGSIISKDGKIEENVKHRTRA